MDCQRVDTSAIIFNAPSKGSFSLSLEVTPYSLHLACLEVSDQADKVGLVVGHAA